MTSTTTKPQLKLWMLCTILLTTASLASSSTSVAAPPSMKVSTRQQEKEKKKKRPSWREGRVPKQPEEEEDKESADTNNKWWNLFGSEKKDSDQAKESEKDTKDNMPSPSSGGSLFARRRKQREEKLKAETVDENNKADADGEKKKEKTTKATDDDKKEAVDAASSNSTVAATNTTTTASDEEKANDRRDPKRGTSYSLVFTGPGQTPPRGPQSGSPFGAYPANQQRPMPGSSSGTLAITQALALLVISVSRIWLPYILFKRLLLGEETIEPTQHFVWEVLNDKYVRDEKALNNVLSRSPVGIPDRIWRKHLRKFRPSHRTQFSLPQRTVVVVDVTPNNSLDLPYLSEVVTFLISQCSKRSFGADPEIVMLLHSPGGGVTEYGLAASEVGRLYNAGIDTTVCVDEVAASGGYMIASQCTKVLAAPFAMLGSIGVKLSMLNGNNALDKFGIKPVVLTAGENKSRLNLIGKITSADIAATQKDLVKTHEQFIDLCRTKRPELDVSVCDGTVLSGVDALNAGMIDQIKTSDEYILERINAGDHVLKMHKSVYGRVRVSPLSFLSIMPQSLRNRLPAERIKSFLASNLSKDKISVLLSEGFKYGALIQLIVKTLGKQGYF